MTEYTRTQHRKLEGQLATAKGMWESAEHRLEKSERGRKAAQARVRELEGMVSDARVALAGEDVDGARRILARNSRLSGVRS